MYCVYFTYVENNPESTYDVKLKNLKKKDLNDKINEKLLHEKITLNNSKDLSEESRQGFIKGIYFLDIEIFHMFIIHINILHICKYI
jgi:hypothetical protein